jgi:hypothetical protein
MLTNNNPELLAVCVCHLQQLARFACRLNNVFMYFVATEVDTQNSIRATYGSLVLTFSPPVNGFSFLVRNLNAQTYSNRSQITVTTVTGSVTHSMPLQNTGDINFVGWFQNDSSITSVSLSPMTFKFSGGEFYIMAIALDELRVYTRNAPAPSIAFSLDNCETPNPAYPNGTALASSFIASTVAAGLVASLQNFDSATASSTVPNSISFPTGSAFNGSVGISVVNGTLTSQTCTLFLSCSNCQLACNRRELDHDFVKQ